VPVVADASVQTQSDAKPVDARPIDAALADAATACPQPPSGCTAFSCSSSSSCYYTCGSQAKVNWATAAGSCTSAGLGCIVTINDQAEQDCITFSTLPSSGNLVWFGLRQSAAASEPDGSWGWECGASNYVQLGWGGFQPDDANGNEDCAALAGFGVWTDANCAVTGRYVCELN
jgi:hypothetical protein